MWFSLEIFVAVFFICLSLLMFLGTWWAFQWVLERFIEVNLPLLVDLYGRIRYPERYRE